MGFFASRFFLNCYKIVFGLVKINLDNFFVFAPVTTTRGHAYKLYKPRCSNVRANFFSYRVVEVWNSLPEWVSFENLSAFCTLSAMLILVDFKMCIGFVFFILLRVAVSASC